MSTSRNNFGTYVPVQAVDWGKAIGGLYKTVNDIGESREKEKQALDQVMTDSLNIINNSDMLKTQSLNDYILAGAENGRSTIKSANDRLKSGQITPKEYKAIINNVNTYWSSMGNNMKNFDATNQEVLKRQQPGEDGSAPAGSEFELFLSQKHANLADLRNSMYQFNPNTGEGYMVKIDPVTGTPSQVINSMSIADPSNIMDQRYDFDKEIMTFTRGLKNAYTMESDTVTLKDPMKRPEVANAVAAEITNLTGTPRMIGQFLSRYGGFEFYETEEEKNQIIMSEIQNENKSRQLQGKKEMTASEIENFTENMSAKLIKSGLDNSNKYQPIITPEQQKEAEEILRDMIVAQFPISQTEDERGAPRRSSGSKSTYSADKKALSLAQQVRDALSVTSGDQAAKNINQIVGGKNKRVKWTGNNFAIETYFPDEKPKDARGKDIRGSKAGIWKITTPDLSWQTSDFGDLFGYGSGGNKTKWEEAVDALGAQ